MIELIIILIMLTVKDKNNMVSAQGKQLLNLKNSSINFYMVEAYWDIGKLIVEEQKGVPVNKYKH